MSNLEYIDLEMQVYLMDEKLRISEARSLFRFRTRMAKFWENFKGGRPPEPCPICKEVDSVDTEEHSFKCKVITSNISIEGEYIEIFGTRPGQKIAKTVENIEKFREQYLDK